VHASATRRNPFEKFGLNWLSPSQLNTFQREPAQWVAKYLFGIKDEFGPAPKRGTAVEAGADVWLYGGTADEAQAAAHDNFALNTQGLADEEHEVERALIAPMLTQAMQALDRDVVGRPVARQLKIELRLDGVEIPIVGYVDYLWPDYGIDLKTTKRMPSKADWDHVRQIAIYQEAKQRPFKLLYVTDKKRTLITPPPSEVAQAMKDMARTARALRKVLDKSDCREEVAEFFVPNRDSYRWDEQSLQALERIYDDNDNRSRVLPAEPAGVVGPVQGN
jgi:RecB family exonuclease